MNFDDIPWKATHVHLKTGGLYQFLTISEDTDNPDVLKAVYRSSPTHPDSRNRNRVWIRDYAQFMDGRFAPLVGEPAVDFIAPPLFVLVVDSEINAKIISGKSKIPHLSTYLMLQDVKGLGPVCITSCQKIIDYSGLNGIFPLGTVLAFMTTDDERMKAAKEKSMSLLSYGSTESSH